MGLWLGLHQQPVLRPVRDARVPGALDLIRVFRPDATQSWALLTGMAGYTLLLAVTASLLVRFVGVWDDVGTLMLLAVLMILATSVTFDVVLARDPARGVVCYLGGLATAVVISEGMLRGVRLRLAAALPPARIT